ncbi:MAG TPA: hypothetical protein VJM31_03585 [Vicinamibacterales bacterium]|nr:hypothetical protein [Vicinamibacterales bacterium]
MPLSHRTFETSVNTLGVSVLILVLTAAGITASQGRLRKQIQKANPKKFETVRDAKQWRNPFVVVTANGIEVISTKVPGGRKHVAVEDFRSLLMALPLSAWPYGRVVALQDNSFGPTARPTGANIIQSVKRTLTDLDVEAELWPR